MSKRIVVCFWSLVLCTFSLKAGDVVVINVEGKAEYIANSHKHPLQKGLLLMEDDLVYIPYNGSVTFIDEANNKEYNVKAIGWATVEEKLSKSRHTVVTRTKEYVKSLLAQFRGKGVQTNKYVSDPATVTRNYYDSKMTDVPHSVPTPENSFLDEFNSFEEEARREYDNFRKEALKEYTDFVRQAWKEYGVEPPIEQPQEEEIEPILVSDADEQTASWFSRLFFRKKKSKRQEQTKQPKEERRQKRSSESLPYSQVLASSPAKPQPQPKQEVLEIRKDANNYKSFKIFGTEIKVRIDDNCRFHLSGISNIEVADALDEFSKPQYNNLLYDCLEMRKKYAMSDWAYYQMLLALTDIFYGKDTNEAALALGFLYTQSGYKARFASTDKGLQVIVASEHIIYNTSFIHLDGYNYYLFKDDDRNLMKVCPAKLEKEGAMSLRINAAQDLALDPTPERTITSYMNKDFSFTITSNKNYMDFYDTYPPSCVDDNFMTKWAMYANTPLEKGIQSQLYPAMEEKLKGLTQKNAVQQLLWWVQTGLEYGYDEEIWGHDRAFFGEESLFYPYCDCEDRSILFSHLVRDLLGLKVVLVHYPGHLATAVNFTDEVEGDYIMLDGSKFVVCDPTYIRAYIGETPTCVDKSQAVVILLD